MSQKLNQIKLEYKVEIDERVERERGREKEISERIAQLDAAVKVYQDQGAGGFLKDDGLKKAAELLKNQGPEREALRKRMDAIQAAKDKAREDLQKRYDSLDQRIVLIQGEISDANTRITSLTTGGAEQADNVKTALQNLQEARASVDSRIATLESEIAEASRKITALSETSSAYGPDSSAEIEEDERRSCRPKKRKPSLEFSNLKERSEQLILVHSNLSRGLLIRKCRKPKQRKTRF